MTSSKLSCTDTIHKYDVTTKITNRLPVISVTFIIPKCIDRGDLGEAAADAPRAGSEKLRGHVRTIWHYGENAVALRRSEHETLARAGQVLSCPPLDVADAALALQQQVKGLSGELRAKDEMIASLLLEKGGGLIMSPVPTAAFQKLCREEGSFLVLHEEGGRTFWLLNGDEEQFRAFKEACASCGLKGGGRGRLYQGSAECTAKVLAGKAGSVVDG